MMCRYFRRTERIRMSTMNVKTYQKANSISAAAAPACERINIRPSDSSAELRHPKRYSGAPEPRNEMTSKIRRLTDIGHGRLDGLIAIATTSSVLVRHCLQDSPLIGPLCHKSSRTGMMQMMQMPEDEENLCPRRLPPKFQRFRRKTSGRRRNSYGGQTQQIDHSPKGSGCRETLGVQL